jgi:hypothetical protein
LEHLDLDIERDIEACDWLTLPEQRLRMVTAGAVYHDEVGLQALRERLAYHPHDVGHRSGRHVHVGTHDPESFDDGFARALRPARDQCPATVEAIAI